MSLHMQTSAVLHGMQVCWCPVVVSGRGVMVCVTEPPRRRVSSFLAPVCASLAYEGPACSNSVLATLWGPGSVVRLHLWPIDIFLAFDDISWGLYMCLLIPLPVTIQCALAEFVSMTR